MNTKKVITLAGLALAIGCVVISFTTVKRRQAALTEARPQAGVEQRAQKPTRQVVPLGVPANSAVNETVGPQVTQGPASPPKAVLAPAQIAPPPTVPDVTQQPMPGVRQPGSQKAPAQDPVAREALSLVGEDPEAEAYWATAINNPNLPDEERKDLIEDLNEDGLSDAKHPGPEDLPLILNRIELIQELAPDAMDQVNADAFAEAYKDLVNMLNGQPVQ